MCGCALLRVIGPVLLGMLLGERADWARWSFSVGLFAVLVATRAVLRRRLDYNIVEHLVLALYVQSPDVRALYAQPAWIWLSCPILLYWLGRLWTLAGRGALRGDPILYALRDPASLLSAAALAAVFVVAL